MKSLLWRKSEKLTAPISAIMLFIYAVSTACFGIVLGKLITAISEFNLDEMKMYIIWAITLQIVMFIAAYAGRSAMISYSIEKITNLKNKIFYSGMGEPRGVGIDLADFTTKINTVYNDYYLARWEILQHLLLFLCAMLGIVYIDWII